MDQYSLLILFLLLAYFLGSIPFGYLISKIKKIDIRKQGSGNIGATNVSRVLGFKYALLVGFLDILKAFLPIYIASHFISNEWHLALIMLASVLGHVFTFWLKFKGGKAVSTIFASILFILGWKYSLLFIISWAIGLRLINFMSLTNLIIILLLPILFWIQTQSLAYLVLSFVYIIIIYWAHRENIKRLLKGTENRLFK